MRGTMAYSFTEKKRIRNNFGSRESILTEPDLLAIQIESFNDFIQADKQTKSDYNPKTGKTTMTLTWYRHF